MRLQQLSEYDVQAIDKAAVLFLENTELQAAGRMPDALSLRW